MEFAAPRPLSPVAGEVFDRHIARIYKEGRLATVDQDLLAAFAETTDLYLQCKAQVDKHGVLVRGRTERELVRNPALTPLAQARADLIRLAKAVPLVSGNPDYAGAELDAFISEMQGKGY
jgi:P27 family predicted phage terminase small subunit